MNEMIKMMEDDKLFNDFPKGIVSLHFHHHSNEITIYSRLELFTTINVVYEGDDLPLIEISVDGVSGEFHGSGKLKFTDRGCADDILRAIHVEAMADKGGITYLLVSHKRISDDVEADYESFVEFVTSEGWTYNPRYADKEKK